MSETQPTKRAKFEHETILDPALLTPARITALGRQYRAAEPFPLVVVDPLCREPARATAVKDEIVKNLESTYKETDLFKLYQTTDLANIQGTLPHLVDKLPELMRLRDELYSSKFRQAVAEITGCPPLTDRVDMAASAYGLGSHLLCHDDVIGTRAVSFIVYLVEPGWSEADGGALELYPLDQCNPAQPDPAGPLGPAGVPTALPSARISPQHNTMRTGRKVRADQH